MSTIARQRTIIAAPPAAERYPTAEPLFITCMCGPFTSILSAAVGREPIGDPPPDDVPDDDEDDEDDEDE
jgi:hypothetical protein